MAAARAVNEAQRRRRKFRVDLQERVRDCLELGQRGLVLACEAGLRVPQSTQEEWIGGVDDVSALPLEHVDLPVRQPVLRVLDAHASGART